MIRNAVRAVILDGDKILLNQCSDRVNGEYDCLPGGGQNQYESIEEALIRECKEETGFTVSLVRFAALSEEIWIRA